MNENKKKIRLIVKLCAKEVRVVKLQKYLVRTAIKTNNVLKLVNAMRIIFHSVRAPNDNVLLDCKSFIADKDKIVYNYEALDEDENR